MNIDESVLNSFSSIKLRLNQSNYLSQNDSILAVSQIPQDWIETFDVIFSKLKYNLIDVSDESIVEYLQSLKKEYLKYWCFASVAQRLSPIELSRLHSRFAELTVQFVLHNILRKNSFVNYHIKLNSKGEPIGLFILGLGKLGSKDLNFSSDIDLIAFYENTQFEVPLRYGKKEASNSVLQKLTQILSYIDGGGIWRVDWDLRPDSSSSGLVHSTEEGVKFYYNRAPMWHRVALIKARPIAGDIEMGKLFLQRLEHYIWRSELDYEIIDEMLYLKTRINKEHPALRTQWNILDVLPECEGFNVKLGHGGIREIEFLIYAKQLLFGGINKSLRSSCTRNALSALQHNALINDDDAQKLLHGYNYLRKLEDSLQMIDNRHTHTISSGQSWQRVLALLDEDEESVRQEIFAIRVAVFKLFNDFFKNIQKNIVREEPLPHWINRLNEKANDIVGQWQEGFICYGITPVKAVPLSNQLYPKLLQAIDKYTSDYSESILRLHLLFLQLPSGNEYFRLMQNFDYVLDTVVRVAITIPTLYNLLIISPRVIEPLIIQERPDWLSLAKTDKSEQEKMAQVRLQLNERLAFYYLPVASGECSVPHLQEQLSELAMDAIKECIAIACNEYNMTESPIGLLAFGRLAGRRMNPLSDIDLVYLNEPSIEQDIASEFANRLNYILQSHMSDGLVYQVDNRLRPSGKSGSISVTLTTWEKYLHNRSYTWEHIALIFAKTVVGGQFMRDQCHLIKKQLFSKKRNTEQCKMDAVKMIKRIRIQRGSKAQLLNIKERFGGSLECEFLIATTMLLNSSQSHSLFDRLGLPNIEAVEQLLNCRGLREIWDLYNVMTGLEKLFDISHKECNQISEYQKSIICKHLNLQNFAQVQEKIEYASQFVVNQIDKLMDYQKLQQNIDSWQESYVQWQ